MQDLLTESPRESVATASPVLAEGVLSALANVMATVACPEGVNNNGVNMPQLSSAELRAQRLERENADLKAQLSVCEARHSKLQQVLDSKQAEVDEKNQLITSLQSRLSRLSSLAAAVTEEVNGAHSAVSRVFIAAIQPPNEQHQVVPAQHEQQLKQEQQDPCTASVTAPRQYDKPAPEQSLIFQQHIAHLLTSLHQQPQQVNSAACSPTVVPAAAAALPSPAVNIRLPSAGSKRSRLCSATGSGGDLFKLNVGSAGSGSSSSRQQLSEELDEEQDGDEADCDEATAGCLSAKRQRSPGSCEHLHQIAGQQHQFAGDHMEDADDEDDKSQDDLDAAQCLQQLAMSAAEVPKPTAGVALPTTLYDPATNQALTASNLSRWGSGGHTQPNLPIGGSSSSNAGGNGQGSTFDAIHAQLLGILQGSMNLAGIEAARAQQQPQQNKKVSMGYQQQRQLHHFGSLSTGNAAKRESMAGGGSWNPGAKVSGGSGGNMAAPLRARKQSWFQTEIAEKIPLSVQQACAHDWAAQQCMQVVCADLCGTFYINSGGEYMIKLAHSGEVVTPNKFEELAGKKTARNWQQSIRLVGYTMNGEPNSALLKLGHFTRIVGLVQDR